MTVRISNAAAEAMRRHAEQGYPLEICGFLVGTADDEGRAVREAWPARNAWEDDPALRRQVFEALESAGTEATADRWESADMARRFIVDPKEIIAAMKRAREAGLDLIGLYHTHPNHPAIPSEFDLSVAWPEWSYVILSVRGGQVAELRSWVLNEEERRFEEEQVVG
jgi:proteasome lid subunit RPN8/RPN11